VNFWLHLKSYIFKIFRKEIPFNVLDKELLIRGIVHPMYYSNSNQAIKREAFLPPSNSCDVSLLRRLYTNDDFCKERFAKLKLGDSIYCGIATFFMFHVEEIKNTIVVAERVEVTVKGTPLDDKGNYITTPPVYKKNPGTPMHADLVYESPILKGQPNTKHRKFASKLAKKANYFSDPYPMSSRWQGEKLKWINK
jgi:hypothetical protein